MANVPLPSFKRTPTVLLPLIAHNHVGIAVAVEVADGQAAGARCRRAIGDGGGELPLPFQEDGDVLPP